jgi:hypothetical protein
MVFDDTTNGTAVAFNQGVSVAASKAITAVGALALNMTAGAFDFTLKLADAVGAQKFTITDSASVEVARVDSDGNAQFDGSMTIGGSLFVQGTKTYIDGETTVYQSNYLALNSDYVTVVAQSGGTYHNYLPTTTTTNTTGAGVFVAGVDGVSNPTVTTAGAATFSAGDLVQLSGSTANANDMVVEVHTHAAGVLTIRSTAFGITDQVEAWTGNQFTAGTDTGVTLRKCNFGVTRIGTDGILETGAGAVTPITYTDVATGIPGWTDDGTVVRLTTSTDNVTIGSATAGGKLYIDSDADELQLQVDGFTTQTGPVAKMSHFAAASTAATLLLQLDSLTSFTGRPRGLTVDFANGNSITNANDVYGIELLGQTNAGAGASVGTYYSGWDVGARFDDPILMSDGVGVNLGSDFDFAFEFVPTTFTATDVLRALGSDVATSVFLPQDCVVASNETLAAGGTITVGDVVAIDSATSKIVRADADHATTSIREPWGILIGASVVADDIALFCGIDGMVVRVNTNLSAATVGDPVYESETAGQLTTTAPSTTGSQVWRVGYVHTAGTVGTAAIIIRIQFVEIA